MKKKILAVVLGLTLCFEMTGCTCEGSTTHVVYIIFNEYVASSGYGHMSPYYSENGKLCTYDTNTKQIVEIGE